MLAEYGDPVEGESLARESLRRLDPKKGEHRVQAISAELTLGKALSAQGRHAEAVPVLARVVERAREQWGDGSWRMADALISYGGALAAERRFADAEPVLRAGQSALAKSPSVSPRLAARAATAMARLSN
jgi:hypothetical protein